MERDTHPLTAILTLNRIESAADERIHHDESVTRDTRSGVGRNRW